MMRADNQIFAGRLAPSDRIANQVIAVVMGVSGSGKTTVAALLANALGCQFQEGDDLHSANNIEKMRDGAPLTDEDRLPWLQKLAGVIEGWRARGESGVLACSALKKSYRDILVGKHRDVTLIYLKGSYDLVSQRMGTRQKHFMPVALLQSQISALQEPTADEHPIIVGIDGSPTEIVAEIMREIATGRAQAL